MVIVITAIVASHWSYKHYLTGNHELCGFLLVNCYADNVALTLCYVVKCCFCLKAATVVIVTYKYGVIP